MILAACLFGKLDRDFLPYPYGIRNQMMREQYLVFWARLS